MAEVTNYIDRLVAELCPDGVEYRPLGEIADVTSGCVFPVKYQGNAKSAEDNIPFYKVSDMNLPGNEMYMTSSNNYVSTGSAKEMRASLARPGSIIFPKIGAAIATNKKRILTEKSIVDNNVMVVTAHSVINSKFLYYVLTGFDLMSWSMGAGAVPSIKKSVVVKHEVPVPPMEIQEAIVEILDQFAGVEAELEAQLEAELEARTLQYEYYRDSLFEAPDCPRVPLNGLLKYEQPTKYLVSSKDYDDSYPTPVLTAGKTFILGYTNETEGIYPASEEEPVIIFDDFTTAFKWVEFPFKAKSSAMKILTLKSGTNSLFKYVYYAMQCIVYNSSDHARQWISKYSNIEIPLPSSEEQQRIVDILDRFDALTTSLSEGLPAELAARRSQYEYYRDQLLSFPRKGENQ